MLGLHTPQTTALQILENTVPKETSTDRMQRTLEELMAQDRAKDDPSAH